jgi:BNR/Asp-box repeat.
MRPCFATVFAIATFIVIGTAKAATWTHADLPVERVFEVAAHPTLPAIALAATSSGVYRTSDAGSHWQHVTDLSLIAFAFNPFRAVEICALVDGLRAPASSAWSYCSSDLGLTWLPMPSAGLNFLLFDRQIPDRMYSGVGYGNQWILASDDHGKTWRVNGYTAGHPNFHGWGSSDLDSTVYVTSWPHGGPGYDYWTQPVYRSRDSGNTWQLIDGEPSQWTVAIDSSHGSTLYFAVDDLSRPNGADREYTIQASTDGGVTWETRGKLQTSSSSYLQSLAASPARNTILYAGCDSGSVSQSLDDGRTWKRIDDGQIHEAPFSNDQFEVDRIHSIAVGIDGTVYAATGDAVFTMKILVRKHTVRR